MKIAPDCAGLASWIVGQCKRLARGRDGNFGLLTALAFVPMIGAVGLAYDYTNMLSIKTHMSDSLDAAAFEAAKLYAKKASDTVITDRAGRVFKADLEQHVAEAGYSFSYDGVFDDAGAQVVRVSASAAYQPTFMPVLWGLLGQAGPTLAVARQSEVSLATSTVELALVLDNSGSMNDNGKITALKQAATGLVDDLFASAAPGGAADPVKISVVPFAGSVNVGAGNRNAAWMDTNGLSSIHHENFDWTTLSGANKQADGSWERNGAKLTRFWLYDKMKVGWRGCVEARPAPYDTNDAAPDPARPDTLFVPMFAPDEPDDYWYYGESYYDNSYISDQASSRFGSKTIGPAVQPARQYWMDKYTNGTVSSSSAPNYGCTTLSLMPLSTSKQEIRSKLQAMYANGSTNVPQGVAWGMHTLTPGAPFAGARAFGEKGNIKAMVVMTDGENTYYSAGNHNKSTYGAYGYASTGRIHAGTDNAGKYYNDAYTDSMNQHLLAACKTARDKNIMVFTIAFDVKDGSSVKTMLRDCASNDGANGGKLYFDAKDSTDLKSAFGVIGSKISGLRLYR